MGLFWDVLLGDILPVVGWIAGILIALTLALWLLSGLGVIGRLFTVDLYRALVYERRGICGVCKKPYARSSVLVVDRDFGPEIRFGACPRGHVSTLRAAKTVNYDDL